MKSNRSSHIVPDNKSYIDFIHERLKSVMPEVHRQVRVFEEKRNSGKLTAPPKNSPLFSE
jgi:hypothetical protein